MSYGAQWIESNDLPTTITASGTPHTPGSWVEIITSTDAAISFVVITACLNVASGSVNSSQICDIATGGVGAETVIISDLNFGHDNGGGSRRFTVPVQIPAGTRISARLQSSVASATNSILIDCFAEGAFDLPFFGEVDTLEVDAASSHGNVVHNLGTGGTFTGWTQIIASTAEDYRGFIVGIDGQDTSTGANDFQVLQIGIGGSGSEIPVGACFISSTANELVHWRGGNQIWLPEAIPAGSRISIRSKGYGAQNAFNMGVNLYGIYGDVPAAGDVPLLQRSGLGFANRSNTSVPLSSVPAGKFILAIIAGPMTGFSVTLSGYTDIDLDSGSGDNALSHPTNNYALRAYYKFAAGGETAVTWNHSAANTGAWVGVYDDVDPTTPIDHVIAFIRNNTTQSIAIPTSTFTTIGRGVVAATTWDPYPSTAPPVGHKERFDAGQYAINSVLYVADKPWAAGATGGITVLTDTHESGDDRVGVMIPLRKASGAPPPSFLPQVVML